MKRRGRRPVPPVRGGYPSGQTPPSRMKPPRAPQTPGGIGAVFVPPPLRTPSELEAEHVARDLAARAQLAEVLRPFDRSKRRELVLWAMRELVDAPTAPTPKEPT